MTLTVVLPQHETLAPHLTAWGYLPTTPVNTSLAISLKTLQCYKYLCQRKASFSVEAFAKVLCDLYGHPFRRRWSKALVAAFDVFVSITVVIEKRVDAVLKHDTENWRVCNTCPACFYELEGEPSLCYRVLCAVDGNTSLKRLIDKGTTDARKYAEATYIIPPAEVDAMDKKSSHVNAIVAEAQQGDDNAKPDSDRSGGLLEVDELEVDNGDTKASDCTRNWKAAQSDSSKKAMGFFDEIGVFACVCRHGIVLWMADMIQSGELFKYPLAIVNRALTVFKNSGSRIVVALYHEYAHNFSNIKGAGLEDFETLECLWSGSNAVVVLVRNATRYRRHMFIELYMKQSNADKYLSIGEMLLGNYKQALDIIERKGALLKVALEVEDVKEEDLDQWQMEQREYFGSTLGRESDGDVVHVVYVEMLKEWHAAVRDTENKSSTFLHTIPDHFDLRNLGAVTYQERALNLDIELQEYENKLSLPERWTRESADFQETKRYIHQHAYHQALNNLQCLVVQHLFELHWLNLSGRSAAIRRAIEKYNSTIRAMGREDTLDWERAAKYSFIEEFDLLKEGQANLADKRWKEPAIREMMKKHQQIKRAREEIERLNVEIQQVYSSTKGEEATLEKVLDDLAVSKNPLRCVVEDYTQHRVRVNAVIRARLHKIVALPGYTGDAEPTGGLDLSTPNTDVDAEEGGIGISDDYDEAQVGGFIDILSDLTVG
ncbi:hypothetical protein FA13DRAFT_1903597 [Coprinellus micaceus]|uniref:CxC1-like cysteine cluster associated with KDZ transposases domain-containing protein n=1 Tax=Coprinellus micaceus TaxID=71717 RepID=A0A4Y7TQ18_COPMI|nr:hypothetical protein FA13DRAFT_1903597 [Coprinellus micaceus]